ncbi:MAG: hypothetical protein Tsb0014_46750 [Pleurocapsa sp.]
MDLSQLNYIERANLRINAEEMRRDLVAENRKTYRLEVNQGVQTIVCLCCGLSSADINDVKQKYCRFCCTFHE